MSTQTYFYPTAPLPISLPHKGGPYAPSPHHPYSRVSVSPPEAPSSVTTSGVASYEPSATSSSYAASASASEYEAGGSSAAGVDLMEYMGERLQGAGGLDKGGLDGSLVRQVKTSAHLNAKHRELLELQALAQRRLAGARANFADGMRAAKEVQKDLQWTQKRVDALNDRAARKYPEQFQAAQRQFPAAVDY